MFPYTLRTTALVATMLGAAATGALAQGAAPMPSDQQAQVLTTPMFVRAAAQSDEFEAQEGRLAQTHSSNAEVRAYGQKMIKDHGTTTAELKAAIERTGMAPPPPVQLTAEQYAMLANLKDLQGQAFDAEYAKQAVVSHRNALGLHEEYNLKGDNPTIKQASMLATPLIKEHLRDADNMALTMRPPHP